MSRAVEWMDRTFYPGLRSHWDDLLLRQEVLSVLEPSHHLLDLGAGAGIVTELHFKGLAARVCGVDPDPRVLENPHLDEGRQGMGEDIPWEDATFDIVVCDNVLEHLEEPAAVFAEVARVLKPGGRFLAKTPNALCYPSLAARVTPLWFHKTYNKLRGRDFEDTFPTTYLANTPEDVSRLAAGAGLEVEELRLVEGRPEYLRLTVPTYVLGVAVERALSRFRALARFRTLFLVHLVRPAEESPA